MSKTTTLKKLSLVMEISQQDFLHRYSNTFTHCEYAHQMKFDTGVLQNH